MASKEPTPNDSHPDARAASRREFLKGRAALSALADKAKQMADAATASFEVASGQEPQRSRPQEVTLLEVSRRAMACDFQVQYHAADGQRATGPILDSLDLLEAIEARLTIYRDTSDVLEMNASAATAPVEVEPRLFQLLQLCAWLQAETSGAFDITSGPLSRVWGFLKREGRVPAELEISEALKSTGGDAIRLNEQDSTIEFLNPRLEINLNSIGKGYAIDRLAEQLAGQGVDDFLWHGGRSSVLARGKNRSDSHEAWTVGIRDPVHPERRLAEIHLRNQALGTAGSGTQFFEHQGRRYGHVIDPRTGWPAEGVFTATAIAETAAEADALATAFYVLGPGGTAEYCAAHPEVAALLVCPPLSESTEELPLEVHAFNLADDAWTRCPLP
ncbi:FAD:protein FMN transferase [Adhaeretor mobilis]|uniref:FAD:protein FMN transferase n=1 Tax=Adhaeretor mobilis TaxID=1930276 RepID=A0A517MSX5_9BACT|nr:FAD:protein FMN transferase [Adhaeretor mobilis]QDS97897.1 Thiamine biosynthesis lipoprotein ApbE precursor [Adhaeretor mobilis]